MRRPALFTELYKLFKGKFYIVDKEKSKISSVKIIRIQIHPETEEVLFETTSNRPFGGSFIVSSKYLYSNHKSAIGALKKL